MVAEDRAEGRGPGGGPWPVKLTVGRFNLCSRQMALTEHRHQLGRKIRGGFVLQKSFWMDFIFPS